MFNKLKGFIRSTKGKIACAAASCAASLGSTVTAFAAEGGSSTTFTDGIKTIWSTITEQINIGNVVAIIGIVIGAVIGLGLFWFGLKYAVRKIWAALKKGKVSV